MRIVSWNVNGQRTLRGYRPWYSMKTWAECLDHLEADMICFQEVKMTRKALLEFREMCLPEGYEAYYSLHPTKGYSGVSTFVKTATCSILRAEQGLTGELVENRRAANNTNLIGGYPDDRAPESPLYDVIDAEGRGVMVDCGFFVLFNLYCPNETDEGRRDYKMAYYHTLAERVENLRRMGREVIIVGDLNIAHLPIDHCDGVGQRTRDQHLDIHPARRWLDQFLAPMGAFHDVTRMHHPTRKFMYTCWDTVKDTRPCNYGVRIDYIFVTEGLLPWVKFADIQPNIFGSDHCPVYVDFHDEIPGPDGTTLRLSDKINAPSTDKRKAPALATCSWPEFAGRRIQSFFAPSSKAKSQQTLSATPEPSASATPAASTSQGPNAGSPSPSPAKADAAPAAAATSAQTTIAAAPAATPSSTPRARSQSSEVQTTKAAKSDPKRVAKKGNTKGSDVTGAGQKKLQSFFTKKNGASVAAETPGSAAPEVPEIKEADASGINSTSLHKRGLSEVNDEVDISTLGAMQDDSVDDSGAQRVESALAWGSIFAPKEPPLCTRHGEPAKPWTVNKAGPNHGRKFWMCARPVGDAGTGNPADNQKFRCEFWKWDSDVRKRQRRQDKDLDGSARSFHDVAGTAPRLASGEKRGPESLKQRAMHKAVVPREKK